MTVDKVTVGSYQANCYILTDGNDVLVIDPGDEYNKIEPYLTGKNILGVLVTHFHEDHVSALPYFDGIKVYGYNNLKFGLNEIGPFSFEAISTPGHTDDSVTYYFESEKIMFTGDFLFKGTVGRTDLPTGSGSAMKSSLIKISKYPDDTDIYPGHGFKTTLLKEKENNVYFSKI